MRAARIAELGQPPRPVEVEGDGAIEVRAVALNPLDLAVAAGRFYGGHPALPYVPGCEAVGSRNGERIYLFGEGRGTQRDGFLVERTDFPAELGVPVPEGLDDAVAAACGVAGVAGWMPVATRAQVAEGDRVLVLGATGTVGSIALQAAQVLGAERVVGAGRNYERLRRALELGADTTVLLEGDDLVERLREACGGDGPTVVVDPLWGEPVRAAVEAAAPKARIVHVGQSAGPEATFASAAVRGKQLSILGHSNFGLTPDERRQAYVEVTEQVAAGRISIAVETFSLDEVASAWSAQGGGAKAVVRF
ncbi:MAG: quinone oxidoreductase family protein [Gaiellaceae bacterium]